MINLYIKLQLYKYFFFLQGKKTFQKKYICRYCYQTDHWEHQCHQKNSCSSVASPQQYYRFVLIISSIMLIIIILTNDILIVEQIVQ